MEQMETTLGIIIRGILGADADKTTAAATKASEASRAANQATAAVETSMVVVAVAARKEMTHTRK